MNEHIYNSGLESRKKSITDSKAMVDSLLQDFKKAAQPIIETDVTRKWMHNLNEDMINVENAVRLQTDFEIQKIYKEWVTSINNLLKYLKQNFKIAGNSAVFIWTNRRINDWEYKSRYKYSP